MRGRRDGGGARFRSGFPEGNLDRMSAARYD